MDYVNDMVACMDIPKPCKETECKETECKEPSCHGGRDIVWSMLLAMVR